MPARPPERGPEWLPSGFPPRSFPPGMAEPPPTAPRPRPERDRGRGRWLALAALGVAVLLLAAGLVLATRDDDSGSTLATNTSTSTSSFDTSVPGFDSSTTTALLDTTTSIDATSTTPAGATTTTSIAGGPAGAGALEPSLFTVNLPRTDATAAAARGPLVLRNVGGTALTYTTRSSSPGLSAAPARGTIQPGAAANLTVTLDGSRIPTEGPFAGTLTFASDGAAKAVEVRSVTGRPPVITDDVGESCPQPTTRCSRQIKLAPSTEPEPSPCNTPWLYSVTIADQSRIQTSTVIARRGIANADAGLRRIGTSNVFLSEGFTPLLEGTVLRFAIEATDEHGFTRRISEQIIAC